MSSRKSVVSPEPRKARDSAFEDLENHPLKKGEIGWVEKTSEGWVACIREEKVDGVKES